MPTTLSTEQCFHCGSECDAHPVRHEGHAFCCSGCQTVYDILQGSRLSDYYSIDRAPGKRMDGAVREGKFAFLDLDEICVQLLEFDEPTGPADGRVSRITFYIPAVHCSSCIYLLENLHTLHPAVGSSRVNFVRKEASVTFDRSKLSLRHLVELLTAVGYEPEINLANTTQKQESKTDRGLTYRLAVAGFCFGNIMLLSFPEYLGLNAVADAAFVRFFGYLNIVLSLPVFAYSASGYLVSAWKSLRHGFVNIDVPVSLGILALFGRSVYEILSHTGAGYLDSLAGLVFFLLIGKWYQNKTYQALSFDRDYESYFPIAVTRIGANGEEQIPLKRLAVGDVLLLRNGELIPADCVLTKGHGRIDYSFVTGESDPVSKSVGDRLQSGGRQVGEPIEVVVKKEVAHSYLTRLWNQSVFAKDKHKGVSNVVDRVSRWFTLAVIVIALGTGAAWFFIDPAMIWPTVTSVLIVACPCALALTLPFALGHTMRLFGKSGMYVKNAQTVEAMANITDVVFDKTGTLTHTNAPQVSWHGKTLAAHQQQAIAALVRNSAHPLSRAVYDYFGGTGAGEKLDRFEEFPGAGISGIVAGTSIMLGSAAFVGANTAAATGTQVWVRMDGDVQGHFAIGQRYRNGLQPLIARLKKRFRLHLLSGDNDHEQARLSTLFGSQATLHFGQSPTDKLTYIEQLRQEHRSVLMVGDGLNDAGALRASDVGISVADNVFQFSPACDAILDASSLDRLAGFMAFSKTALKVVRASFVISLLYNIVGVLFAVTGLLTPLVAAILMPLSSVSVVVFVTVAIHYFFRKSRLNT